MGDRIFRIIFRQCVVYFLLTVPYESGRTLPWLPGWYQLHSLEPDRRPEGLVFRPSAITINNLSFRSRATRTDAIRVGLCKSSLVVFSLPRLRPVDQQWPHADAYHIVSEQKIKASEKKNRKREREREEKISVRERERVWESETISFDGVDIHSFANCRALMRKERRRRFKTEDP